MLHYLLFDYSLARSGGLAAIAAVLDISEIIHFRNSDKSSSILRLIKWKSRDLRKLLKYFSGASTSVSNVLSSLGAVPIIFVLYAKRLTCCFLVLVYPIIINIIFISVGIYFISIIISGTFWCHRIIATIF